MGPPKKEKGKIRKQKSNRRKVVEGYAVFANGTIYTHYTDGTRRKGSDIMNKEMNDPGRVNFRLTYYDKKLEEWEGKGLKGISSKEVDRLLNQRDKVLKADYDDPLGDYMADTAFTLLAENFDDYPVDFTIECLTRLGFSIQLVYDDNGRFAVSAESYGPVVSNKQKIAGAISVIVTRNQWKKTVREALKAYITKLVTEFNDIGE